MSGGVVGVGSKQKIISNNREWRKVLSFISSLKEKRINSLSELRNLYDMEVIPCLDYLINNNFFMDEDSFDESDRYSRNHLYYGYNGTDPVNVQRRLLSSKVTIIGCGGIGTNIAYYLSTSGVGEITLIDNDVIEISNLTRQVLFCEDDIGKKKVEILKRELIKRNGNVIINVLDLKIASKECILKIPQSDLYIVSADSPFNLIDWINETCVYKKQAYINIGYINDISVIGPFYIPGETACIRCANIIPDFLHDEEENEWITHINHGFKPATFPGVNGVAASYAFTDIVKYLGGFGEILSKNKRIGIHSAFLGIEKQEISPNRDCFICGKKQI